MEKQIKLHNAPWLQNDNIGKLFDAYAKAGFEIRLVGGCVRDVLCDRPIKDWDLATPALPKQSMKICRSAGAHVIKTGLKHGTITAIINSEAYEITTLRRDQSTDGRHAKVAWTNDWKVDAMRRDFTINALYGDATGNVIDYTGGLDDLENNIIRFIGEAEQRITEDYLRIMRFFRFMGGYGDFARMDEPSLQACAKLHPCLTQISSERIRDELWKILMAQKRSNTIELMAEVGIFKTLKLPLIKTDLKELDIREKQHGLSYFPLRALAYLLDPNHDWRFLKKQFALSNKQIKYLQMIHQHHPIKKEFDIITLRHIYYHMQKHFDPKTAIQMVQDLVILNQQLFTGEIVDWKDIYVPPLPVSGKDLIKYGLDSGKEFGHILEQLERVYIESDFTMGKAGLLKKIRS